MGAKRAWAVSGRESAIIVGTWLFACLSKAQSTTRPGEYNCSLLTYPAVQRDIGIARAIVGKIDAISEAADTNLRKLLRAARGKEMTPDAMRALYALKTEQDKRELELLTSSQRQRLRELTLQAAGPQELENPRVAKALGLSKAQVSRLDRADQDQLRKMLSSLPTPTKSKWAEFSERSRSRSSTLEKLARAILTPAQWKGWVRMQGRPLPIFK